MTLEIDIDLEAGAAHVLGQAEIGDDGIGAFEHFGFKGYDIGYPCVDSVSLVSVCLSTGFYNPNPIEYQMIMDALSNAAECELEAIV